MSVTAALLTEQQRRFLQASQRFATIATINADGSPHQTVIWYLLREDDSLVINSRVGRRWPSNLLRDPRTSLCIEDGLDYVVLRGEVVPDHDPEQGQAVIAEMARKYETPETAEDRIKEYAENHVRMSFRLRPRSVTEHFESE